MGSHFLQRAETRAGHESHAPTTNRHHACAGPPVSSPTTPYLRCLYVAASLLLLVGATRACSALLVPCYCISTVYAVCGAKERSVTSVGNGVTSVQSAAQLGWVAGVVYEAIYIWATHPGSSLFPPPPVLALALSFFFFVLRGVCCSLLFLLFCGPLTRLTFGKA